MRQTGDPNPNAPNGINSPTLDLMIRAGFTVSADQTAIQDMIDNAVGSPTNFEQTWLSLAYSSYQNLTFDDGSATGGTTTSLADTGKMWTSHEWQGGAVFVNAVAPGDTVLSATSSTITVTTNTFVVNALTNWKLYLAGAVYTIMSNMAGSITVSGTLPTPVSSLVGLNYAVGWASAVGDNTATSLTGLSPALPVAPTGLTYSVVAALVTGGESFTYLMMMHFRSQAPDNSVLGNNSLRATTTATGLFADLMSVGPPIYFQTAADNFINGSSTTTFDPLADTLNVAISLSANYVELPSGYHINATGTATLVSASSLTDGNSPFNNTFGNGVGGQYGRLFTTSGPPVATAQVASNTIDTLTLVGPWNSAEPAAGVGYEVDKWDYISPSNAQAFADVLGSQLQWLIPP